MKNDFQRANSGPETDHSLSSSNAETSPLLEQKMSESFSNKKDLETRDALFLESPLQNLHNPSFSVASLGTGSTSLLSLGSAVSCRKRGSLHLTPIHPTDHGCEVIAHELLKNDEFLKTPMFQASSVEALHRLSKQTHGSDETELNAAETEELDSQSLGTMAWGSGGNPPSENLEDYIRDRMAKLMDHHHTRKRLQKMEMVKETDAFKWHCRRLLSDPVQTNFDKGNRRLLLQEQAHRLFKHQQKATMQLEKQQQSQSQEAKIEAVAGATRYQATSEKDQAFADVRSFFEGCKFNSWFSDDGNIYTPLFESIMQAHSKFLLGNDTKIAFLDIEDIEDVLNHGKPGMGEDEEKINEQLSAFARRMNSMKQDPVVIFGGDDADSDSSASSRSGVSHDFLKERRESASQQGKKERRRSSFLGITFDAGQVYYNGDSDDASGDTSSENSIWSDTDSTCGDSSKHHRRRKSSVASQQSNDIRDLRTMWQNRGVQGSFSFLGMKSDRNRRRRSTHVVVQSSKKFNWPDPQEVYRFQSTIFLRLFCILNFFAGSIYMYWRVSRSMEDLQIPVYSWMYFAAEVILVIAIWTSHFSRMFPQNRINLTMDDLVDQDPSIGDQARVSMLCPTAGEKLRAFQQVLFGALGQRLWKSKYPPRELLRIIILDEKRRPEIYQLASMMYSLAELLMKPEYQEKFILEGIQTLNLKDLYEFMIENRHRLPETKPLKLANEIRTLITKHDDKFKVLNKSLLLKKPVNSLIPDLESKDFKPGFIEHFCSEDELPHLIYFTRSDAGTPRESPKAGNMNAALFPHTDYETPLIGESDFVMVNDARHRMEPEYLQRTCPYFFKLQVDTEHNNSKYYRLADVGFIQVPQRFPEEIPGDPLGNHAAIQYEVANVGRDGIGAMMSCGHGSIWSMRALSGYRPDGSCYKPKDVPDKDLIGVWIGFKAIILIEDTHTSIGLFHQGWRSVFVAEPGESLGWCVHQPDSVKWRIKQVFRWHMGAVQLWLLGLWVYKSDRFPSIFHKCIMFDATTYFFQAFAGQIILFLPVVYGIFAAPPFKTYATEFIMYFFPFLLTGLMPTIIGMQWKKAITERVMRDEQTWFATAYVHIYAFIKVVWQRVSGASAADAWRTNCPCWPLYGMFFLIGVGFLVATYSWIKRDFEETWVYLSALLACGFSAHAIWPMCALGLNLTIPPAYYLRFLCIACLLLLISYW